MPSTYSTGACCPMCRRPADHITTQGPSAYLLCLCDTCDRLWRVKVGRP